MSKKNAVIGLVAGTVLTGVGLASAVFYGIKWFKKN